MVYNGGDIMELNPIKRIKLHKEFKENDRKLKLIDDELDKLVKEFHGIDHLFTKIEIVEKENKLLHEHTSLLKRNTDILNSLYGGLK